MELFEHHFSNLSGNLYHDEKTDTFEMFSHHGKNLHLNYLTFRRLFQEMDNRPNLVILESGISSAGTHSTHLLNEYVRKYGGRFWSVDINPTLVENYQGSMCPATTLVCDDSVHFFTNCGLKADVIYLDSWDLDWYNPHPAAQHGLQEYHALKPCIQKNTLLLIDDTPANPYWLDTRDTLYHDMVQYYTTHQCLPGKGQYIAQEPKNATVLLHQYQLLYKCGG